MLGLGNSTSNSTVLSGDFVFFKSRLSSSDFTGLSIEGGDMTFTEGSTVDGTDGWLKCVYPNQDQSNQSGITNNTFLHSVTATGSNFTVSYDIYLEDSSKWQGPDDVRTHTILYNYGTSENIPVDQSFFYESTSAGLANNNNAISIYWLTANDLPKAGATFYIKNLTIKINS
jgi:hypothetical protein